MTATTTPSPLPVAPVLAPARGLGHELRAVRVVWVRDLQRFWADKARIVSTLIQPLLLLFVLGKGLASAVDRPGGGDYTTFLFPGVLATGVMFTAVFSAVSIVWDREFGFLREMLVAPIGRTSIVVGKCLGGATVATLQGLAILALAGLVHVPYDPLLLLGCAGVVFVTAFSITAFGLVLAVRVQTAQAVMTMVQMLLAPLMFLSGALFPAGNDIPAWLRIATRLNPMSYAVDATRSLVVHFVPAADRPALSGGLTWWGWRVPGWLDVLVVLAAGLALLVAAGIAFARE
jgi:ABC-2 type transport system permease protein